MSFSKRTAAPSVNMAPRMIEPCIDDKLGLRCSAAAVKFLSESERESRVAKFPCGAPSIVEHPPDSAAHAGSGKATQNLRERLGKAQATATKEGRFTLEFAAETDIHRNAGHRRGDSSGGEKSLIRIRETSV